jgi:hypothetical protein
MDPSDYNLFNGWDFDFSYTPQSPYVSQDTRDPSYSHLAFDPNLQTLPQSGELLSGIPSLPHSNGSSSADGTHNTYSAESVTDTTAVPPTSMGPPARSRKRKAPTLSAAVWEPYRSRIIDLYNNQGLPLREVKQKIEEEFGFHAE